jgi:hypothetical protein
MLYEEHCPDEQWDSMTEMFDSMSYELVRIGFEHGSSGKVRLREFYVHDWYSGIEDLYENGFEHGLLTIQTKQLKKDLQSQALKFRQFCIQLELDPLLPQDLIPLINMY